MLASGARCLGVVDHSIGRQLWLLLPDFLEAESAKLVESARFSLQQDWTPRADLAEDAFERDLTSKLTARILALCERRDRRDETAIEMQLVAMAVVRAVAARCVLLEVTRAAEAMQVVVHVDPVVPTAMRRLTRLTAMVIERGAPPADDHLAIV